MAAKEKKPYYIEPKVFKASLQKYYDTDILTDDLAENIKNLHNIVFASGGKSFIRTVQSIGRGLRKHASKNKLVIFDICDRLRYGIRHCEKRKEIYDIEKIKYSETNIVEK